MSGKRIVNAYKNVDKNQSYALVDAVKIVKDNAKWRGIVYRREF